MKRLGVRYLLPLCTIVAIVLFPPWAQDDLSAPAGHYRGTKYSAGHSFIFVRPGPGVTSDPRIYSPPATVPVAIDREEWSREAVVLVVVSWLLAVVGARSALTRQRLEHRPFGGRTVALAMLSALVIPTPDIGPLAFLSISVRSLTDFNHGIPMWLALLMVWAIISFFAYLAWGALAFFLQRRTAHDAQRSSRMKAPA